MKFAELKTKPESELRELLAEKEAELHALRLKAETRSLKQVHQIKVVRRIIAQVRQLLHRA